MYKKARLKLTLAYTAIILILATSLSLSIYVWFSNSLGEGYVTEVRERHTNSFPSEFENEKSETITISATVALEQLEHILIASNLILIFLIPTLAWYLTDKTFKPIEKAGENQRSFVSSSSHEFKTPLSIISGEIDVTLKKKRSQNEYENALKSIKDEIKNLDSIVNNLLFLAGQDESKDKVNFKNIDITDVLSTVISKFSANLKEKNINLNFSPPDRSVSVFGEESMLAILFSNIIDNAIKYTKTKGKITVEISYDKKRVYVSIKDTGTGIAKNELGKIFNRFYRSESTRHQVKGFGLGLSIVDAIIKRHKGKVKVVSELGKGTTFTVNLPKTK